ncbi:MAG: hypothetical protein V3U24_05555 [Candidatus Neomarinimicrobiota bacterium]
MVAVRNLRNIVERWRLRIWMGAFFFAAILWLFVISEQTYTYVLQMPIEVRNIKEGKTMRGEGPPTAEVRFRATGRAFLKALLFKRFSDFKLVLDLDRISTNYDFYLNDYYGRHEEKVVVPASFELEFVEVIQPDSIQIELVDYMIKPVIVVPRVVVEPAPGFTQVGPIMFTPETIELRGPKEIILFVETVETEFREFLDIDSPVNESVPLSLDFPRVVETSSPMIDVFADIQSIGERIITEVPIQVLNQPDGIRVFPNPSTVSLTVTGGVQYIAGLEPSDIEVFIDFASRAKQQTYHKPTVRVPEDILEWRDLSPKNVELAIAQIRE